MSQSWFLTVPGDPRIVGPFRGKQLKLLAKQGKLRADALISCDKQKWFKASRLIKDLAPAAESPESSPRAVVSSEPAVAAAPTPVAAPKRTVKTPKPPVRSDDETVHATMDDTRAAPLKKAPAADLPEVNVQLNIDPVDQQIQEALDRPKDWIPGYEIVGVLGRGGMGVVFRAKQTELDRMVAIKTILVSQLSQGDAISRFKKEARAVARVHHPHVVTAYHLGELGESSLYFVMELLEGESLESLSKRQGTLSEPATWGLVRQAASGLSHAANLGVIHRDIKPANLFLVEPPAGYPLPPGLPMVKITDFGVASLAHSGASSAKLAGSITSLGTPLYMAPEQFSQQTVDQRADIYALGTTAYQLLAGCAPFDANHVTELLVKKVGGEIVPIEMRGVSVSQESSKLVHEMIETDPDKRIPSYDRLLERIDAILAAQQSPAMHAAMGLHVQPQKKSNSLSRWFRRAREN